MRCVSAQWERRVSSSEARLSRARELRLFSVVPLEWTVLGSALLVWEWPLRKLVGGLVDVVLTLLRPRAWPWPLSCWDWRL